MKLIRSRSTFFFAFLVMLIAKSTSALYAQTLSDETVIAISETVIAISKDGSQVKTTTSLQAAVISPDLYPSVIKVFVESQAEGYILVELLDKSGKRIHRPVFIYEKKGIIKYDLSNMSYGKYLVKIKNKHESQMFEVAFAQKISPVIEVKRSILAKIE
jgi:hypothetical protein